MTIRERIRQWVEGVVNMARAETDENGGPRPTVEDLVEYAMTSDVVGLLTDAEPVGYCVRFRCDDLPWSYQSTFYEAPYERDAAEEDADAMMHGPGDGWIAEVLDLFDAPPPATDPRFDEDGRPCCPECGGPVLISSGGPICMDAETIIGHAAPPPDESEGLREALEEMGHALWEGGGLDGFDVQDIMEKHGILVEVEPTPTFVDEHGEGVRMLDFVWSDRALNPEPQEGEDG